MLRRFIALTIVALFAAAIPLTLSAQASDVIRGAGPIGSARVTFGGAFGGLSGGANLNDAGTADWRLGWAASVDATAWLTDNFGVRATGGWSQDSLRGAALTGRGMFNKFTYDADLVARYPFSAGSGTVAPYLLGGAGGISLHQLGSDSTWSKVAGNFGAGIEYRFSRLGIRAEGRDIVYTFDRYGFSKTQHDVVWQGGVTVSF